jgi:hypothetical protein
MTTDAIFFLNDNKVIRQMMMTEFDALLDGIVELPELKGKKIAAVYVQIADDLKIKGLLFFILPFDNIGQVQSEWNVPINQLMQSSGRGPDLGAGAIRLVSRKQCSVPWHKESLWDPQPQLLKILAKTVQSNRLGIVVEESFVSGVDALGDIPVLTPSAPPVVKPVMTAEPPLMVPVAQEQPKVAPVLADAPVVEAPKIEVPSAATNEGPSLDFEEPTVTVVDEPVTGGLDSECLEMPEDFGLGLSDKKSSSPVAEPGASEVLEVPDGFLNAEASSSSVLTSDDSRPGSSNAEESYRQAKMELDATKAAFNIKMDSLKKEREQSISASLKAQNKEQIESLTQEFHHDIERKDEQLEALKKQLELEQNRYVELKEQHVEQASQYETDREDMMEQLQQGLDLSADKVEGLKDAFKKEVGARIDAETAKINEKLAIREVELFYREEQMKIVQDDNNKLRVEKQNLMKDSGDNILESLDDNGVTFVTFQSGVGHLTIHPDDIGRFLDKRLEYLSDRCGVTEEDFMSWQRHYQMPTCQHVDATGQLCGKQVERIELAGEFKEGSSDRCSDHQVSR